jgi:hypothetical protein
MACGYRDATNALGAMGGRVLRQLISESFVLAVAGGVLGEAVAIGRVALVREFGSPIAIGDTTGRVSFLVMIQETQLMRMDLNVMKLKNIGSITGVCVLSVIAGYLLTAGGSVSHAQAPGIGNEAGQPFQIGYKDREVNPLAEFVVTEAPQNARPVIEHVAFSLESADEGDAGFKGYVRAWLQTRVRVGTFTNVANHALTVTRPDPPHSGQTGFLS